jgi:CO/xanthine dehydrogenase FAD-binding subunit
MSAAFCAPTSLADALALLAEPEPPVILAGGTDLWPKWSAGLEPKPTRLLSLHRLGELREICLSDGLLRVGALCSHAAIRHSPLVQRACPALSEAAGTVGAVQIQHQGTLGGNLANASPAADLPPPLLAAGAHVELCSASGRRRLPLASFYLGYRQLARRADELLTAVLVPPLAADELERFRKVGTRRAQAISKVVGACRLRLAADGRLADAAFAFGSVAPVPLRLGALEDLVRGQAPGAVAAEAEARAAAAVQPIDDLRSLASYRCYLVGRLVRRWLEEAAS